MHTILGLQESISPSATCVITHTPLNRLTGAAYSTGKSFAYQHDAVGNRTAMTATQGVASTTGVHTYTYDAANRLTSAGGVTYTWDDRGNLTNDGVFTYTYNAAGRLARAQSLTSTLVYTYNAQGLRVAQSVDGNATSGGATTYAWDWASGVPEMLSEGQAMGSSIALYLVGHETLGRWDGSQWAYYLPDALGSVRQVAGRRGGGDRRPPVDAVWRGAWRRAGGPGLHRRVVGRAGGLAVPAGAVV